MTDKVNVLLNPFARFITVLEFGWLFAEDVSNTPGARNLHFLMIYGARRAGLPIIGQLKHRD